MIWFVRSRRELRARLKPLVARPRGRLWIAWPKQASGVPTDLSQPEVRRAGLVRGWVDYKISSLDATWSGLLFTKRKGYDAR